MTPHAPVHLHLHELGYTIAGGVWGDAAWKQIADDIVVSIGQQRNGETGYLSSPSNRADPCAVYVYRGRPEPGWHITDGEAPLPEYAEFLPNLTLAAALRHIAAMENAEYKQALAA
jgi:hypothetical protein